MHSTATKRGSKTQQRIVLAAAELIHRQGANGTSVDEILTASRTGKSQFYHYFHSKDELIHTVLAYWIERSLVYADEALSNNSHGGYDGIVSLFDGAVDYYTSIGCSHGCPIASLALELGGADSPLRCTIDSFYREFQNLISTRLEKLQAEGLLSNTANLDDLAVFISTAFHGSLLLTTVYGDTTPITTTKEAVLAHIQV